MHSDPWNGSQLSIPVMAADTITFQEVVGPVCASLCSHWDKCADLRVGLAVKAGGARRGLGAVGRTGRRKASILAICSSAAARRDLQLRLTFRSPLHWVMMEMETGKSPGLKRLVPMTYYKASL